MGIIWNNDDQPSTLFFSLNFQTNPNLINLGDVALCR